MFSFIRGCILAAIMLGLGACKSKSVDRGSAITKNCSAQLLDFTKLPKVKLEQLMKLKFTASDSLSCGSDIIALETNFPEPNPSTVDISSTSLMVFKRTVSQMTSHGEVKQTYWVYDGEGFPLDFAMFEAGKQVTIETVACVPTHIASNDAGWQNKSKIIADSRKVAEDITQNYLCKKTAEFESKTYPQKVSDESMSCHNDRYALVHLQLPAKFQKALDRLEKEGQTKNSGTAGIKKGMSADQAAVLIGAEYIEHMNDVNPTNAALAEAEAEAQLTGSMFSGAPLTTSDFTSDCGDTGGDSGAGDGNSGGDSAGDSGGGGNDGNGGGNASTGDSGSGNHSTGTSSGDTGTSSGDMGGSTGDQVATGSSTGGTGSSATPTPMPITQGSGAGTGTGGAATGTRGPNIAALSIGALLLILIAAEEIKTLVKDRWADTQLRKLFKDVREAASSNDRTLINREIGIYNDAIETDRRLEDKKSSFKLKFENNEITRNGNKINTTTNKLTKEQFHIDMYGGKGSMPRTNVRDFTKTRFQAGIFTFSIRGVAAALGTALVIGGGAAAALGTALVIGGGAAGAQLDASSSGDPDGLVPLIVTTRNKNKRCNELDAL